MKALDDMSDMSVTTVPGAFIKPPLEALLGQDAIMLSPASSYVAIIIGFTESPCKA